MALWKARADELDLRPMVTRGKGKKKKEQECAALLGLPVKPNGKACARAFQALMGALTANGDTVRENAWALFEAMLPRLHEDGAALDGQVCART